MVKNFSATQNRCVPRVGRIMNILWVVFLKPSLAHILEIKRYKNGNT